jgi:hypothetical protein
MIQNHFLSSCFLHWRQCLPVNELASLTIRIQFAPSFCHLDCLHFLVIIYSCFSLTHHHRWPLYESAEDSSSFRTSLYASVFLAPNLSLSKLDIHHVIFYSVLTYCLSEFSFRIIDRIRCRHYNENVFSEYEFQITYYNGVWSSGR